MEIKLQTRFKGNLYGMWAGNPQNWRDGKKEKKGDAVRGRRWYAIEKSMGVFSSKKCMNH